MPLLITHEPPSACFKLFQPDMYDFYEAYMGVIRRACPHLRFNFEKNVFAAATFNLGPEAVTRIHVDDKNLATGWCAIMALGNYDYKKGGHIVLWDLKLVIEFPPGTVIFIPSALLRRSNTTITPGEERMSFTQFTPGGLFRWVDCGMQTQKQFFAQGGQHTKSGAERYSEGVGRFSIFDTRCVEEADA